MNSSRQFMRELNCLGLNSLVDAGGGWRAGAVYRRCTGAWAALVLRSCRVAHGEWINDYTDPQPGRYHAGLKAGQSSQAGCILKLTLCSLVVCGQYDEVDFCRRMDEELMPLLDGTPINGPGGYTCQSIRDLWRMRVQQKLPWGQTGGHADTTEAIERTLALAVRYARA